MTLVNTTRSIQANGHRESLATHSVGQHQQQTMHTSRASRKSLTFLRATSATTITPTLPLSEQSTKLPPRRQDELVRLFGSSRANAAPTAAALELPNIAALDSKRFKEHWSVAFWRDFTAPDALKDDSQPLTSRMQSILQLIGQGLTDAEVFSSRKAAAYWAYHLSRSSFFITQGFAGLLAARTALQGNPTSSIDKEGVPKSEQGIKLERLVRAGISGPVVEALGAYYQDWQNIKEGVYRLPWDMTTLTNRQFNPLFILQKATQFIGEATATLQRRSTGKAEDVWLQSPLYPNYYLNTFHYQTDGWLSQHSAQVYEVSTETLFVGRQDAMQRQTLVPLAGFVREKASPKGEGMRLLEVAAGTGRFATFIKDNFPRMHVTALDLSPYFLQEARANIQRWSSLRAKDGSLGGPDGTGTAFLQAAAEAIPSADGTYDAVTCIYLFHELPPEVRKKAAADMARVLKPGGLLVLTDSVQIGDRSSFDANLGAFGDFNEPYYRTYITADLGKLFVDAGLEPEQKLVCSSSKTLSFRKPYATKASSSDDKPTSQMDDLPPKSAPQGGADRVPDDTAGADKDLDDMPAVPAS